MKLLAGVATVGGAVVLAVLVLWPGPAQGPEPIAYGRDVCAHCRMHLGRVGFAGEMRDREGRLTKYDDIGCLLRAMAATHHEVPGAWVEDHDSGAWLSLLTARFVRSPRADTPMGHGIVAFETETAASAFAAREGGTIAQLEDLLRQPGSLAATGRTP